MSRPLVVLADPDYTYLAPMELKFLEELRGRADVEVITDGAYLREYLSSPHDIEALLISEEWFDDAVALQNVATLLVLTEDRDTDRTSSLSADYTFKYTSLNLIFNKVVSSCPRLRDDESTGVARVLLFHSPVGGAGTTTAAIAVASCLRGAYRRVLYVDAECVQTFGWRLRGARPAPPEMVRAMQRQPRDAYESVRPHIATDCFDYLPPLRSSLMASGVEPSFFARLVESARVSGDYDYIVVDTGSELSPEVVELIGLADRVVVMVGQDEASRHKLACFLANIDGLDADTYRFVCNRYVPAAGDAQPSPEGLPVQLDGFVEQSDEIDRMDVLQLGEVAGFRRLAHGLE